MIPFHIATPQGCNIQTFYGFANASSATESRNWRAWNKPVGVSHIYMMLIGGGGEGNTTDGGGSGAVTVWYGAAQHVPDVLQVYASAPDNAASDTEVAYLSTASTEFFSLLIANSATGISGANASNANYFGNSGFYKSTAGQDGFPTSATASATTFLSGGAGSSGSSITANYGYTANITGSNGKGYFQLQPIIVGVGSAGNAAGVVGCGSGEDGALGGQGFVLIASW